jgi:hypothetical protein
MRYTPAALAALGILAGAPVDQGPRIFYATCDEKPCRRMRTFRSKERAEASGWHIGGHHLCPKCAGQRREPNDHVG